MTSISGIAFNSLKHLLKSSKVDPWTTACNLYLPNKPFSLSHSIDFFAFVIVPSASLNTSHRIISSALTFSAAFTTRSIDTAPPNSIKELSNIL